jgi:protein-S-isoprenylcysteine O-methyltransferase Ste14
VRYDRGMPDLPSIVVFASWAIFAITWAIAALFVKRTVERRWGWGRIMILIVGLAYLAARNSQSVRAWRLFTSTPRSEWLGAAVVLIGLAITLWARLALGRNWSGAVTLKQDHELIESGPYRFVRHPIYTGVLLMALGTAVLTARVSSFVFCALLLIGLWFKLRAEEQLMTEHFPEAYPRYRQRVRALIPFLL